MNRLNSLKTEPLKNKLRRHPVSSANPIIKEQE